MNESFRVDDSHNDRFVPEHNGYGYEQGLQLLHHCRGAVQANPLDCCGQPLTTAKHLPSEPKTTFPSSTACSNLRKRNMYLYIHRSISIKILLI
jgi:hypothetical protein